jgi:hypothetical protein
MIIPSSRKEYISHNQDSINSFYTETSRCTYGEKRIMYIYLDSGASSDIFPDNTAASFRTRLSRPLNLYGPHEVAVLDVKFPKLTSGYKTEYIMLKSSICVDSFVDSSQSPVMARFSSAAVAGRNTQFTTPRYVRLNTQNLHTLDVYLTDARGHRPSFESGDLLCTLHVKKCLE